MKLGPALLLAYRSLAGRHMHGEDLRGRRYLRGAVLGVALSLVPLVVVLVVADGMIQGITARYIEVGTYHLQAESFARRTETAIEEGAAALKGLPGVEAAYPEIQGAAVALAGTRTSGAAIRAVDPEFLADPGTRSYLRTVNGDLTLSSANDILLGEALARSLAVGPGDTISIVTARATRVGEGGRSPSLAPKVSVFRIRGIVSAGYRELDALWAFVNLKAGSRILATETSRAIVGIKTFHPFGDLEPERAAIKSALAPDWTVSTWPEIERNLFKSFATTRALLILIMALAVGVAAINVSSALVMLVLERRRDIAILKSAGAGGGFIGLVFLLAGLATGGAGTVIGLGLGALVAWRVNDLISGIEALVNAVARIAAALAGNPMQHAVIRLLDPSYYLERIPVNLHFGELALVAAASLALCSVASLIPAYRAVRLPPLEIFRKT